MATLPIKALLSAAQERALIEARVAFMNQCPFFCYYYYDQLVEYPTYAFPMAATDSKRVFFNPAWFCSLRPPERCFVLAHEVYHAIWGHCKRIRYYRQAGFLEGLPFDQDLFNHAADYVINADLIAQKIGLCNPEWLYRPDIAGTDKIEDVYKKLFKEQPPIPKPPGPEGEEGEVTTRRAGKKYGRGSQPDKDAGEAGGGFDEALEPHVNPVTGSPDEIDEITHKEAVARAAAAAKAIGKMPGSFQRMVDEILEPQINWREHVRMLLTGKLGQRRETWENPNRRRLVTKPLVFMPGKRGHGAELVAVWIDNSGSISKREYDAFFSEVGGVLTDVRPRRLLVGWCDAKVQRVEWSRSLDEFFDQAYQPTPGGGGTDFHPPFNYMRENELEPETLIYLTDLMGPFPRNAPSYPVVWCATTDHKVPWGDLVRIRV
jgi:predicted metal-dependent peptidase